jgi:hypothetical protein
MNYDVALQHAKRLLNTNKNVKISAQSFITRVPGIFLEQGVTIDVGEAYPIG